MKYLKFIVLAVFLFPIAAFAQEAASPDVLEKILSFMKDNLSGPMLSGLALVLDFVFVRMIKTKKPVSLLRGVISVLKKLSSILIGAVEILDKVIPQRVEEKK